MDAKTALSKRENFQELLDTVKENFIDMRRRIKDKTFDLDNQDDNGKTVLINVIEMRNFTEQMWVLLDYNADPNIQDNEGKTPLHYACSVDRKDMIICLLLFGADPEIGDNEGKKPFEDYREDMSLTQERIDGIKREFISLTRKRRKFLKYVFDYIDELGSKLLNIEGLAGYYQKINKESMEESRKDATIFIQEAKMIKNQFEDVPTITFEEFVVAFCYILKYHGMKVIDDFIDRFKKIRPKVSNKPDDEGGEEKKEES